MNKKRSLLIFYDYFYPGYKAGGPIQSLFNLVSALHSDYDIKVITTAFDLKSQLPYPHIQLNSWNKIQLPSSDKGINVYYSDYKSLNKKSLARLINEAAPPIVYLNGIFSYRLFLLPLLTLKPAGVDCKIVVCPRGMLKKAALTRKALKKKIYLFYLQKTGILNKVHWHATTDEEAIDIRKHFPKNAGVVVAPNIPRVPFANITYPDKERGKIQLVYLSLINEHKNLLLLLQLIKSFKKEIVLDIYGPVIDSKYWQQCVWLINQTPEKVQYKGEVQPAQVQQVLSQYHALILLTKGENFGHALYESLSVGRAIITSYFTPWNDLQQKRAGVNVDISNVQDCLKKIRDLADLNQDEYNSYCDGAYQLALEYYKNLNAGERYAELFGGGVSCSL